MSALGFHLRTHLQDGRVIAQTDAERRTLARVVLELGRSHNLGAFAAPDNHLHLWAPCSREAGGAMCQRIESSLRQRLGIDVGFRMYPPKRIADQWHLESTVSYILQQHQRHGVQVDPLREASNLPDLLGLRVLGAYTRDTLQRFLPRVSRADLLVLLGQPNLQELDEPLDQVPRAACRALGRESLQGRAPQLVAARRAALAVLDGRLPIRQVADLLEVTPRRIQALRKRPADPTLVRAIRLQLGSRALYLVQCDAQR